MEKRVFESLQWLNAHGLELGSVVIQVGEHLHPVRYKKCEVALCYKMTDTLSEYCEEHGGSRLDDFRIGEIVRGRWYISAITVTPDSFECEILLRPAPPGAFGSVREFVPPKTVVAVDPGSSKDYTAVAIVESIGSGCALVRALGPIKAGQMTQYTTTPDIHPPGLRPPLLGSLEPDAKWTCQNCLRLKSPEVLKCGCGREPDRLVGDPIREIEKPKTALPPVPSSGIRGPWDDLK